MQYKAKLWGLIYLFVILVGGVAAYWVHMLAGVSYWSAFGAMLLIAVPVTFFVMGKLRKAEADKPDAKLHAAYMDEILHKGYTPRVFEMAEQAFAAKRNGEKFGFVYLKDFVIYTADYYNLIRQSDKAFSYLDLLDRNEVRANSIRFMDKGLTVLLYYCTLMEACRGAGDSKRAEEAFGEVKPYLEKKYPLELLNLAADTIRYHYAMLAGDGEAAKQAVASIAAESSETEDTMSRYLIQADYAKAGGDEEAVREAMARAAKCLRDDMPVFKEVLEKWTERLTE